MAVTGGWSGQWVADRLGAVLRTDSASLVPLTDLVGVALRRNPRRAHLLVSTVLGKHVPADPFTVYGAGRLLGALVVDSLVVDSLVVDSLVVDSLVADSRVVDSLVADSRVADSVGQPDRGMGQHAGPLLARAVRREAGGAAALLEACDRHTAARRLPPPGTPVVIGYAETATALGHAVADSLGADYLSSTRRSVPGVDQVCGFVEEHSHATRHLLLPQDPALLGRSGPLVLVDDELSTGQTVLNTIAALHAGSPREHYVLACLVDLRSTADRERMAATATQLGARIDVVALAAGRLDLGEDFADRAGQLVAARRDLAVQVGPSRSGPSRGGPSRGGAVRRTEACWPVGVLDGGRHGFGPVDRVAATAAAESVARRLAGELRGDRVLVLGFEELMYAPLRIAMALSAQAGDARTVRFSTTTRSPVLAVDEPGYAIRTKLAFPSHDDPDDGPGERYAYNVAPAHDDPPFTDIVVVVDDVGDTRSLHADGGLLDRLRGVCAQVVLLTLPSYRPAVTRELVTR